jgi:hypothetical protein
LTAMRANLPGFSRNGHGAETNGIREGAGVRNRPRKMKTNAVSDPGQGSLSFFGK